MAKTSVEDWHADCVAGYRKEISECKDIPELVRKSRQLITLASQAWYLRGCYPSLAKKRDDLRAERPVRKMVAVDLKAICWLAWTRGESSKEAMFEMKNIMNSLRTRFKDSTFLYACDSPRSLRTEMDERWKCKRDKPKPDFVKFVNDITEGLRKRQAHMYEVEGFEADDILASLSASYALAGDKTIIIANDKDLHQLLSPSTTLFWKGEFFSRENLMKAHSVEPGQWVDWLCLVGKNDIPGAEGIGTVNASKLLLTFGSYLNCLNSLKQIQEQFSEKIASSLLAFEKEYFSVRRLHRLEQTLELEVLDLV